MWTREERVGGSENTMFVHMGGGRVRGLSTWTITFCGDPFLRMNSKKAVRIPKKIVYVVNKLLKCRFEQLYYEFLG